MTIPALAWWSSGPMPPNLRSANFPSTSIAVSGTTDFTYPIAIDNDYAIWRGLHNNAWPAKYLFDAQGNLVKSWIGEGSYDEI